MKKFGLAALGVAAACAACCTIPLVVPLVGALSMGGLASLYLDIFQIGSAATVTVMVTGAGALAWAGARLLARRHKPCVAKPEAESCALVANARSASCGCSRSTS